MPPSCHLEFYYFRGRHNWHRREERSMRFFEGFVGGFYEMGRGWVWNLDLRYLFLSLSKDSGVFVCVRVLHPLVNFWCPFFSWLFSPRSTRAIVKAHSMSSRAAWSGLLRAPRTLIERSEASGYLWAMNPLSICAIRLIVRVCGSMPVCVVSWWLYHCIAVLLRHPVIYYFC